MSELLIKGMTRKEYDKNRYWANRELNIARVKEYYLIHRAEILERQSLYRDNNRAKVNKASSKSNKALNIKQKIEVLTYYGNGKLACVRCGFNDIRALSIDHINGGGAAHIRSISGGHRAGHIYAWLIKNKFPEDYQTLCMNCQWIKRNENNE